MADKSANKSPDTVKEKEVFFKCKFCGEMKPLGELLILKQYYPQIPACKDCARCTKISSDST